jgi:anti-sigma factor RsiW
MAEWVTDYLEAALPLRTRLAARVHLFQCKACTAYYEQMRQTVRLLRRGEPPGPPDEVADAVVNKAAGKGRPP